MRRFWFMQIVASCLCISFQADAQTAEDTVALMLYGVQDGTQQVYEVYDFSAGGILPVTRKIRASWSRKDNGAYAVELKTPKYTKTLRINVRRSSDCEYKLLVSGFSIHEDDNDNMSDETLISVDFSKISSLVYRASQREMGVLEFAGPLRVTAEPNAVCYEYHFDSPGEKRRVKTECMDKTQYGFPTALPFFGLSRPLNQHETAIAYFKKNFCPMRAP
jgi:hypothetical protein